VIRDGLLRGECGRGIGVRDGPIPRQQRVQLVRLGPRGDDALEDVGQPRHGIDPVQLGGLDQVSAKAQCRALPSLPANNEFLRVSTIEGPFCPYQPGCGRPLPLAGAVWPQGPAVVRRTALSARRCHR
jgi:hypothetical protein